MTLVPCVVIAAIVAMAASHSAGQADGIPKPANSELERVYWLGDLPLMDVSPDHVPFQLQVGNQTTVTKVRPKTSQQITHNFVGTTPPRLPRSAAFDLQPFRRVHLLDNDRQSLWMSRGQARPDVQPEWVRVDLPREMSIKTVALHGYAEDAHWPQELRVEVSRDGYRWKELGPLQGSGVTREVVMDPQTVKQVRVTARRLPLVNLASSAGAVPLGYGLCLSDIVILGEKGENQALLSKGAGITVSSTNYGYGDKRSMQDMLWPIHYDLGVKHLKIAYWDSTLNWHYVETVKGEYQIDPRTDAAITEAVERGCEVYMTLCYGNWLYAEGDVPSERWRFWQFPFKKPPVPKSAEQRAAFCNYCRFMATHFKGRIKYYEIWNEQNIGYSWPENEVESFCALVREAARAVREADPNAKIMLGGVCFLDLDYFEALFRQGVAEVVDVLCWHPYQWEVSPEESYQPAYAKQETDPYESYRDRVASLQALAKKYGFRGDEYHANETTWVAPYPAPDFGVPGGPVSEMVKAKYVARTIALHADMGIPVYYNETWNTGIVYWDVSLLRATHAADPQSPVWPQPAYYVLRTMATVTDGAKPKQFRLHVSDVSVPVETCRLTLEDGIRLCGLWLGQRAADVCERKRLVIVVPEFSAREVIGIDTINGSEQALTFQVVDGNTEIADLLVGDYPIMLRMSE